VVARADVVHGCREREREFTGPLIFLILVRDVWGLVIAVLIRQAVSKSKDISLWAGTDVLGRTHFCFCFFVFYRLSDLQRQSFRWSCRRLLSVLWLMLRFGFRVNAVVRLSVIIRQFGSSQTLPSVSNSGNLWRMFVLAQLSTSCEHVGCQVLSSAGFNSFLVALFRGL